MRTPFTSRRNINSSPSSEDPILPLDPVEIKLKIVWPMKEQDALDLLSLVSYIHLRLDDAVRTCF